LVSPVPEEQSEPSATHSSTSPLPVKKDTKKESIQKELEQLRLELNGMQEECNKKSAAPMIKHKE
jgi:hypothetical protein